MWTGTDTLTDLLAGDHSVTVTADAFHNGEATWPGLEVIEATIEQTYDRTAAAVRTSMSLTVHDADGELVPTGPSDPLAQWRTVVVAADVSLGSIASERVPIGEFRIEPGSASGGWRAVTKRGREKWLPTGGTITLSLVDNIARIADAELWGLITARGPTVQAETERLLMGVPGTRMDWTGVPDKPKRAGGAAYGESRLETVANLARDLGRVLATTRDGAVTMIDPTMTAPVLSVTPEAGSWVDIRPMLTRTGIYNVVVTAGQDVGTGAAPPTGVARILTGPYGVSAIGPRVYRHSSDFYRTRAQAQAGADSLAATLTQSRMAEFTVTAAFDPRVDVLDTHRVTIRPGGRAPLAVDALVVGVSMNLVTGGPMTLTYQVPLGALE